MEEVDKPKIPRLVKDFWPAFRRNTIKIIAILQFAALILVAGLLIATGMLAQHSVLVWVVVAVQAALSIAITIAAYTLSSRPGHDLLAAVVHVAGEPAAAPPPNPNDERYEKDGFKEVLQTIYQLASKSDSATPTTLAPAAGTPVATAAPALQQPLEAALNQTSCGFVVLNHDRTITFANKAAPVKVNSDGVMSLDLIFNGADTLDAWLAEAEASAVHAQRIWTRIPDKLPQEENRRFFDVIASYEKGTASEVVLTLIDRTATYEASEQELDFIAFAAHELRGPITVIRGYLDVLEDELQPVLQDDQHELFRRLTVSANRLSGYINNILNTSRYDRRHLKMHLEDVAVTTIYDTIRDDMQLRASSQNRLLTVNLPDGLPNIAADTASLGEVFSNLIDNAIKYSNEGGTITVTAGVKGDTVEIAVQDQGIGMPGNVVSNLFQKFYRSHRSRETVTGTGIGLYISKAIVESHGGSIFVRSEEGKGSTFVVAIPTYASVADKLKAGDNSNEGLIEQNEGWIKNHSMYRG